MVKDKKAEELENKGLWRRAAARWQDVLMDYRQDNQTDQRMYIQRQIQRCINSATSKNVSSREVATSRALRNSAIRVEKEMGIHRNRKAAHDELYTYRGR
ncbi:PerC family transcriptional regulator [Escherichia coli]|uniref:PerC family transcriptional regulator n=1 Tax=Escherichia coli TaxID=562 RepID=UPI000987B4B2|nr:PerC family transcriptional regulator [Escherichia coli]EFJ0515157.1 PerC family transcriptional regulator [Escherichia coli]MBA2020966.1 PerC family transcriptional regulator [Escherichia coli]MCX0466477.1 PerC family transcriptional regulator [Escherichia coli]MDY8855762.1 PerC family transcriptional regulator [Escherichia coli]MDY8977608.1 PerC family transcriptional regulator [Escherichia coli]